MIGNVPISSIYGFWRSSPFCRTCVSGMSIFVNFWPEFFLLRPKCRQLTENVKEAHKDAIQASVAQCFLTFQTSAVTTGRSGSSKLFLFALLLAILYSVTLGSTTIVPHHCCLVSKGKLLRAILRLGNALGMIVDSFPTWRSNLDPEQTTFWSLSPRTVKVTVSSFLFS